MSTGGQEPWTLDELDGEVGEIYMQSWAYSAQIRQVVEGQFPPGPYIPTPDTMREFAGTIKRMWANFLREAADLLDSRPIPQPPPPPVAPAPEA
jgi:hypothetical protein